MKKDNRMRKNAKYTRAVALIGAALALTPMFGVLSGCGGGSKSPAPAASRAKGSVTFRVTFPKKSRVIPIAAQSVVVTLTRTAPGPLVIARAPVVLAAPPGDQSENRTVQTTLNDLELGTYTITVAASPNADGTGTPQASATVEKIIGSGDNGLIPLVMFATVKTLEISANPAGDLTKTKTTQLTATAKDANGATVIVGAGTILWSSSAPGVATVDGTGFVTAITPGSADITAKYKEPFTADGEEGTGATATITIRVVDVGLATTSWPKFHGDARNSGQATVGNSTVGTQLWKYDTSDTGNIVFSSPTIGRDGTVFVGAYDNKLHAINPDGTGKWTFLTGDDIDATPVVDKDNKVFVGSYDGKFYAVQGDTGAKIWEFAADGPIGWSATIDSRGVLFFGSAVTGKTFYALDSLSGAKRWEFNAGAAVQTNAALSPDEKTVYFGTQTGKLFALNAATGAKVWEFQVQDSAGKAVEIYNSSPAVDKTGKIYFGAFDNKVYGLTPAGALLPNWPYNAGAKIFATPAITGDNATVYVATFDDAGSNHRLIAVDANTAAEKWQFGGPGVIGDGITSSPAIGADGVVYVGSYDGNLYAVSPDGTPKWAQPFFIGDTIDSSPAIGPTGAVYIGTFGKAVYAIQ